MIMQEEPSLRHFIPGLKTIVMTDASYKGIGGVLMQVEDGASKPHLCDCFSRNLTVSEQKLHIDQLEAIALKEALLERFDMYIRGHSPKPICYTDNNPLVMAAKKLKPARSYEFCVMEIQNMLPPIDLRHIKGESNRIADALSRAPVELAPDSPFECQNTSKQMEELRRSLPEEEGARKVLFTKRFGAEVGEVFPQMHQLFSSIRVAEEFEVQQQKDQFCRRIRELIQKTKEEDPKSEAIRRKFVMVKGILCLRKKKTIIIIPRMYRRLILTQYHDLHGHFGVDKTTFGIKAKYYWPRMDYDIRKHIRSCDVCSRFNPKLFKAGELYPRKVPTQPFLLYCCDHLGPLGETSRGNKHIIVAVDYTTRFVFASAVPSTRHEYLIQFFERIRKQHGQFLEVVHDKGSVFESKRFQRYLQQMRVKSTCCHAGFQQANGLAERVNQTLERVLSKQSDINGEDWDLELDGCVFAINTTVQKSLGFTPYSLLYGCNPLLEFEATILVTEEDMEPITEHWKVVQEKRKQSLENLDEAQEKMKEYYDDKRVQQQFEVGDLVIYDQVQRRKIGQSHKLQAKYEGIFEVMIKWEDNYFLERIEKIHKRVNEQWAHVSQLKPAAEFDLTDFDVDAEVEWIITRDRDSDSVARRWQREQRRKQLSDGRRTRRRRWIQDLEKDELVDIVDEDEELENVSADELVVIELGDEIVNDGKVTVLREEDEARFDDPATGCRSKIPSAELRKVYGENKEKWPSLFQDNVSDDEIRRACQETHTPQHIFGSLKEKFFDETFRGWRGRRPDTLRKKPLVPAEQPCLTEMFSSPTEFVVYTAPKPLSERRVKKAEFNEEPKRSHFEFEPIKDYLKGAVRRAGEVDFGMEDSALEYWTAGKIVMRSAEHTKGNVFKPEEDVLELTPEEEQMLMRNRLERLCFRKRCDTNTFHQVSPLKRAELVADAEFLRLTAELQKEVDLIDSMLNEAISVSSESRRKEAM